MKETCWFELNHIGEPLNVFIHLYQVKMWTFPVCWIFTLLITSRVYFLDEMEFFLISIFNKFIYITSSSNWNEWKIYALILKIGFRQTKMNVQAYVKHNNEWNLFNL